MRENTHCRTGIVLGLALVLTCGVAVAAPTPKQIGDYQPISIVTPEPYPISFGDAAREWKIEFPGATYIRVHFTDFDLAPGDSVELFDPDGRRFVTYRHQGIHGTGDFWAHTLPGDTAIVRMQATVGGESGFEIDGFGAGFEPIFGEPGEEPGTDSVCGNQDWEDAACYDGSILEEKSRAAVKAIIGCCSSCTAWKMSDGGQFMYNEHCGNSQSDVQATELLQDYRADTCGGSSSQGVSAFGSSLIASDYTLDYTMMQATGDYEGIPCLSFADRQAQVGDRIYIAHHPSGGPKKLSVNSTHPSNPGGFCQVDDAAHTGRGAGTDTGYYCDTIGGSSGSPVIDYTTHEVVTLHHFGGCLNSGARSDLILSDLAGKGITPGFCSDSGGGTPSECGNGTVEWPEACDGADLGGQTCESLGYKKGALACNADCTLDESDCKGGGGGGGGGGTCSNIGESCRKDDDCCFGYCLGSGKNKQCVSG